jgi:hypothetical protein
VTVRTDTTSTENSEIVKKGVRPPEAAAKLLELLNRYSARERENYSHVAA